MFVGGVLHDPDAPGNHLQEPQQRWHWWEGEVALSTTRLRLEI